jgi:hypothetical protein
MQAGNGGTGRHQGCYYRHGSVRKEAEMLFLACDVSVYPAYNAAVSTLTCQLLLLLQLIEEHQWDVNVNIGIWSTCKLRVHNNQL